MRDNGPTKGEWKMGIGMGNEWMALRLFSSMTWHTLDSVFFRKDEGSLLILVDSVEFIGVTTASFFSSDMMTLDFNYNSCPSVS
jgi:hypothetical protein